MRAVIFGKVFRGTKGRGIQPKDVGNKRKKEGDLTPEKKRERDIGSLPKSRGAFYGGTRSTSVVVKREFG